MHQIEVNGIQVDVVRKDIKNLHLAVYPPNGRVRVAAPLLVDDEAVRLAVIERLPWIKRQQAQFQEQERQSEREYINGESHYFKGARYRLNVVYHNAPGKVIVRNKRYIDLYIRPDSSVEQRRRIVSAWYRTYLREVVPPLIEKWESILGVKVDSWGIKEMKTRWGTCNIEAGRVWINQELAKKSERCLEYIVVHEMMHLLERHHNDRFVSLMNHYMPHWKSLRMELNREPLAHEDWKY